MNAELPIVDQPEKIQPVDRRHFLDLDLPQLRRYVEQLGEKPFRAGQIWKWVYHRRAESFDQMTDLPQSLRTQLASDYVLFGCQIVKHQTSSDGTEKFLLRLADGGEVECVLLRDEDRRSICVSSQVGCARAVSSAPVALMAWNAT